MHVDSSAPTVRGPTEPLRASIYIFHIVLNAGSRIQQLTCGRVYIRLAQRILLLYNSCTGCKDHVTVCMSSLRKLSPPTPSFRAAAAGPVAVVRSLLTILRPPLGAAERDASQPDHCVDHKVPLSKRVDCSCLPGRCTGHHHARLPMAAVARSASAPLLLAQNHLP
jgi:hypothetical protein